MKQYCDGSSVAPSFNKNGFVSQTRMLKVQGISALHPHRQLLKQKCNDEEEGIGSEPVNGMDPGTYGPRLYANFKPTKPPGDPITLMHMLKKSMNNSCSSTPRKASQSTAKKPGTACAMPSGTKTIGDDLVMDPSKAYMLAGDDSQRFTPELGANSAIELTKSAIGGTPSPSSHAQIRTDYGTKAWKVDQELMAKATKTPFRLVKKISSGPSAYQFQQHSQKQHLDQLKQT